MNELTLVKSAEFGGIKCDFYGKDNEAYMTSEQLGECLGYLNGRKGIDNLIDRNKYLKSEDFSVTLKLRATDGKTYDTRVFTEDGIYEVTMLSKTEKAKEFRAWVRNILRALRSGKSKIVGMTEYQQIMAQTRAENVRIRKAQILERLAAQYDDTYKQVLQAYATKELTGEFLLPLPELERKTYSAAEIGAELGISAHKVGTLTNANGLKTDEYGKWFVDKSAHSSKEVQTFRYYESVIPVLRGLL